MKGLTRTSVTTASIDISTSLLVFFIKPNFWRKVLCSYLTISKIAFVIANERSNDVISLKTDRPQHCLVIVEFELLDAALFSLFFFDFIKT